MFVFINPRYDIHALSFFYQEKRTLTRMIIILSLCLNLFGHVVSHGYLDWPPQRSSLWRHGFNTPKNYNDNSLYCGGRQVIFHPIYSVK